MERVKAFLFDTKLAAIYRNHTEDPETVEKNTIQSKKHFLYWVSLCVGISITGHLLNDTK